MQQIAVDELGTGESRLRKLFAGNAPSASRQAQIIDDTRKALVRLTLFPIESATNFFLSCTHLRANSFFDIKLTLNF